MSGLGIWTDGDSWVIAESAQEALIIYAEHSGYDSFVDYQRDTDDMPANWKPVPGPMFTINDPDGEGDADPDWAEGKITKSVAKWCAEHGKGFLAGVDY